MLNYFKLLIKAGEDKCNYPLIFKVFIRPKVRRMFVTPCRLQDCVGFQLCFPLVQLKRLKCSVMRLCLTLQKTLIKINIRDMQNMNKNNNKTNRSSFPFKMNVSLCSNHISSLWIVMVKLRFDFSEKMNFIYCQLNVKRGIYKDYHSILSMHF